MWTESTSWGLQLLLFVAPNRQLSARTWKPSFTIFYPVVTTTIESLSQVDCQLHVPTVFERFA